MIDAAHTYRLAFDTALVSDPRCDASVDVALVKQALRVIVQNAAKYSDAGTPITFGITPDASMDTIDISVEDEGIGMNQESAAHAFERFYRASQRTRCRRARLGSGACHCQVDRRQPWRCHWRDLSRGRRQPLYDSPAALGSPSA